MNQLIILFKKVLYVFETTAMTFQFIFPNLKIEIKCYNWRSGIHVTITAAVGCYNHILWFGSITLKYIQGNISKIKINKTISLKITKMLISSEKRLVYKKQYRFMNWYPNFYFRSFALYRRTECIYSNTCKFAYWKGTKPKLDCCL